MNVIVWPMSSPSLAVNITQQQRKFGGSRKIPSQYDRLRTLVGLANLAYLARKQGLGTEILEPLWPLRDVVAKPKLHPVEIAMERAIAIGRRMQRAAAGQCWPTKTPASSFEISFNDPLTMFSCVTLADASLRYLVRKSGERTPLPLRLPSELLANEARFTISSDYRLKIERSDFLGHLLVPALVSPPNTRPRDCIRLSRLKVCPVCDKLFVAFRDDARSCSEACGSIERQRRYREGQKNYRRKLRATKARQAAARKRASFPNRTGG